MPLSLSTLAVVALSACQAAALGINCRGSSYCTNGQNAMGNIATAMDQAIAAGQGGRTFSNGQQMACSWTPGTVTGWICAFWQFADARGTMQDGHNYVRALQNHNCVNCGSVPLAAGNPDVGTGALTVNFVTNPCCTPGGSNLQCYC